MKSFWTRIKQVFCIHEWVDSCVHGLRFRPLCAYRQDTGSCFCEGANHTFICTDKIMECPKCGKRRRMF